MKVKERGRRRFLKEAGALAALTMGGIRVPEIRGQRLGSETPDASPNDRRAYGTRSRYEKSERILGRLWSLTPLQDSMGILTPSGLHYMAAHGYEPPDLDPQQHRLLIHGLVDRPLILTVAELKRLPSVSRIHFLRCAGHTTPDQYSGLGGAKQTVQETHGSTSCSEWTGVRLSVLLQEVGVQKGANYVIAEGAEAGQHAKSLPLAKALDDVIVAYGQNGEALRPEQGYPVRLVVPGWKGFNNVKWVRRIKVGDQPLMHKWESAGYAATLPDGKSRRDQFEWGVTSVITFPSGGQRLPGRGFYEINGLAWSGWGAIRRVEVSTDGGRTWNSAQLQEPVLPKAHTRFCFAWNWEGEEAVLQSRATDERGNVQPTLEELAKFWDKPDLGGNLGLGGVNFWGIFSWKVTREGSVHNATG